MTYDAASNARNKAVRAVSAGAPARRRGLSCPILRLLPRTRAAESPESQPACGFSRTLKRFAVAAPAAHPGFAVVKSELQLPRLALNPESVHCGKRVRMVGLEACPVAQISAGRVVAKACAVLIQHTQIQLEADEPKPKFA